MFDGTAAEGRRICCVLLFSCCGRFGQVSDIKGISNDEGIANHSEDPPGEILHIGVSLRHVDAVNKAGVSVRRCVRVRTPFVCTCVVDCIISIW